MLEIIIRGTPGSGKSALALLVQHYIGGDVPVQVVDDDGHWDDQYTTEVARIIVQRPFAISVLPHEQLVIRTENVPKEEETPAISSLSKGDTAP